MKIEDVPIDKIQIGKRYRKDTGDLEALAANIRQMGLLQPIGLDSYYQLIFGARRLEACADILGWKRIPAVILKLDSLIAGEYAENEFRKQFMPSERAAIGAAVEKELAAKERRGGDQRAKAAIAANADKGKTVDLAAKRAGFKSAETYERAKAVTERGAPELIAAMDKGEVTISAAAAIASQPKADQAQIVQMPKEQRQEVVRHIRKTRADREADERHSRDLFLFRGLLEAVEFIAKFQESAEATWEGLERVHAYDFSTYLPQAINCLDRIRRAHPNETRRPGIVAKKAE